MAERSLGEWLSYLEALHPKAIDLGLTRVASVARTLELIPCPWPVLTVAGTNGKGSVAHCSDALLAAQGLRCGRYTSPHLLHFNERICVNGLPVADELIVEAFCAIEAARDAISLSYFEFATLAALYAFRAEAIDVAVLEVGLGGRLDAVNIVDAQVAVITSIAMDHQDWLGASLGAIGREKAGIGRPGQAVVLAEAAYPDSVEEELAHRGALPLRAGRDWHWAADREQRLLSVDLAHGRGMLSGLPWPEGLQPSNVAAAVQATALLCDKVLASSDLASVLTSITVPARRQRFCVQGRELLLDVAHNPAAMASLARWLRRHPARGARYAALGLMGDKDLPAMAAAIAPAVSGACAVALPGVPRAQSAERIWQVLDSLGVAAAQSEFTVEAVWDQLLRGSEPGDSLVFCGSFHTVAGIMAHLDLTPSSTDP